MGLGDMLEPRSCLAVLRPPFCFSSRTAWVQKIKAASEQYIDTEKKKREKAYQGTCECPRGWKPAAKGYEQSGA